MTNPTTAFPMLLEEWRRYRAAVYPDGKVGQNVLREVALAFAAGATVGIVANRSDALLEECGYFAAFYVERGVIPPEFFE